MWYVTHNDPTQGSLSIWSHCISLIQNDHFEWRIGILLGYSLAFFRLLFDGLSKEILFLGIRPRLSDGQRGKVLNLVADDGNATFVTGIQFEDAPLPIVGVPQLPTERQGDRGFARTGWACDLRIGGELVGPVNKKSDMRESYR